MEGNLPSFCYKVDYLRFIVYMIYITCPVIVLE